MATKKKKKKSSANRAKVSRSHNHRSSNSPKVTLGQARRMLGISGKKKRKGVKRRSSNPFATSINMGRPSRIAAAGAGVLVGVAGVKAISNALPVSITGNTLYVVLAELGITAGLWWLGSMIDGEFGAAVGLGGIAEAGSTALNQWLPSVGGKLALSGRGTGDFVRGRFPVPQNPVLDAATGQSKRVAAAVSAYPRPYAVV